MGPEHYCALLRKFGRSNLLRMDGFCDIGCGCGNPNPTYSSMYPTKLSVAVDVDPLKIHVLKARMHAHGAFIHPIQLDFVREWDSDELHQLHHKTVLYLLNNINFSSMNNAFLHFFRRHAAEDSAVICYSTLFPEYSNEQSTRSEWSPYIEMVDHYSVEVSPNDHYWRATGTIQQFYVYRRTSTIFVV